MYKKNLAPTVSILKSIQNLTSNLRDTLTDTQWDDKTKYFYRLHLPFEKSWSNLWCNHIECSTFQVDPCDSHSEEGNNKGCLIKIEASEGQIHVFQMYVEDIGFLIIESQFPCTYNDMNRYMYAISLSFGLVTTVAPLNYTIVLASKTVEFDNIIKEGVVLLRPTITVRHKQYLAPIKEKDFAKLVLMLHRNENLERAAMMLLVASDDIESLGPSYSVVLETICLELFKENKDIFEECLIEKPWGKDFKNNEEKLTKPFELLKSIKYDLSEVEKLIIKTRNSFLHGDIPKGGGSADELENMDELDSVDELLYISSELRRLCMILLFRYVGIKEPQLAIFYNEKVKQTVDKKLIRKKQKEEEKKKKKQSQGKNNTQSQGKEKSPQPTEESEASV